MTNHAERCVLASTLATLASLLGCSSDIFDVDVAFAPQVYAFDFGDEAGSVPEVACDAADDPCGGAAVSLSSGEVIRDLRVGCNPAVGQCYVQADAELAVTLSILDHSDFRSKVQRKGIELVRTVDLAYAIPVNTLTFDIPEVDIFVGPEGTRRFDDPGVVFVDRIKLVSAGETAPLPTRHVIVQDHSPARQLLEETIVRQEPFVFVLAMSPRLTSGQLVPAGQITVELFPRMRLGIPE